MNEHYDDEDQVVQSNDNADDDESDNPFTKEEAEELLEEIDEAVRNYTKGHDDIRSLMYEAYAHGAFEALGIGEKEFTRRATKNVKKKYHRSYIYRLIRAASEDYRLGLEPGELSENAHRDLRAHVQEKYWSAVIDSALAKRGSLSKVSGKDLVYVAGQLGFLNSDSAKGDTDNDPNKLKKPDNDPNELKKAIESRYQKVPEHLRSAYKVSTRVPKDIPTVKRFLELVEKDSDLAQELGSLEQKDIGILLKYLEELPS